MYNCTFVPQPARKSVQVLRVFEQDDETENCQGLTTDTQPLQKKFYYSSLNWHLLHLTPYFLDLESPKLYKLMHLICTSYCLLLRVFDQDDEIGDPQGLTVVTTLVKWNLKADAKKDVCSSLAPLGACYQSHCI